MFGFTLYWAVRLTISWRKKPESSGAGAGNAASMKYAFQFHCVVAGSQVDAGVTTINPYLSATGCQPQLRVMMASGSNVDVYFVPCSMTIIGGLAGGFAGMYVS